MIAIEVELPELKSSYRLPTETRARFRRDGHVLLRGVCSADEAATFREPVVGAARRFDAERRPLTRCNRFGHATFQSHNLWRFDDDAARFTTARRFAKLAAQLMGVDAVRIYRDGALLAEPGGGDTPWAQDAHEIPLDTAKVVTMWMPLVDVTGEMGGLDFVSASHRDGVFAEHTPAEVDYERVIARRKLPVARFGALSAGDATFHAGRTLHRAGMNLSDRTREVMTVTYFADGARVSECDEDDENSRRAENLTTYLPGQRAGELAGTHLNPIVYWRRSFDPAD